MRPTSDKNRQCPSREQAWAVFLSQRMCWEPSTAFPQALPTALGFLTCSRAESKVQTPARGILEEEEAIFCLRLLGVSSLGTVLGTARASGHRRGSF